MKITNTKSGEAYQLSPGTQIEIERPNLFFNEWGEQSLPVDLPDSDRNMALCGYPDMLGNVQRPRADIECTIQESDFCQPARMAILGAKRKENIQVSFYLNEGAFLSQLKNVKLRDIFGDETVDEISGLDNCLQFCRALMNNEDKRFAIFPVYIDDGIWKEKDSSIERNVIMLNDMTTTDFRMSKPCTIIRDEETEVTIDAGYYISPFIRLNYLLERVMAHFGYSLQPSFLSNTSPFDKMVLLNTTADTLANGVIRLSDLVPDVSCDELLESVRKRFFCEFIPDEIKKYVYIRTFNECLQRESASSIDDMLVGHSKLEYPEKYHELTISCNTVESPGKIPTLDGLADAATRYPSSELSENGIVRRLRFSYYQRTTGTSSSGHLVTGGTSRNYELLSSSSTPYNMDTGLEQENIEIPDTLPEFINELTGDLATEIKQITDRYTYYNTLYAGKARYLNSRKLEPGESAEAPDQTSYDIEQEEELPVIPALSTIRNEMPAGCLTLDGYSLVLNGEKGIFEKFYRNYDNLLRNSMYTVRVNLLLSESMKQHLDVHYPVCLHGHRMLWNTINYSLGTHSEPVECELFTTQLYQPVEKAPTSNEELPSNGEYVWEAMSKYTVVSKSEYDAAETKDLMLVHVYPYLRPSKELFDKNTKICKRTWYAKDSRGANAYSKLEFWLECHKSSQ